MNVYLVRHGEKESGNFWNSRINHNDQPLSRNGKIQSAKISEYFKDKVIQDIYCSEYQRTYETIKGTCEYKSITPNSSMLINEINVGILEKMSFDETMKKEYFQKWDGYQERRQDFKYPKGESGNRTIKRVRAFFKILEQNKRDAIVVTHEGWIKIALCHILSIPTGKRFYFTIDTCGITKIKHEERIGKWKINFINQVLI